MKKVVILCAVVAITIAADQAASTEANSWEFEHVETKVHQYGVYRVVRGEMIKEEKAASGYRSEPKKIELVRQTSTIPARRGVTFGAWFALIGKTKGKTLRVRVVTRFPKGGVRNPETGKVFLTDEYTVKARIGKGLFHAYRLSQSWEVVEGEWSLELYHKGQRIGQRKFNVVEK